ncbi:MAG: Asp-tRNA(Asn)/Glu-tRNA(Gln) amidotransferase subunit GatB [Candidatus Niyogibacteria bacterium]|nr:Asp-tRNA(Asn)/Glu-tRNA(Gln) amidotransferase subunit GatB [Candidatus Niyogibacteria bacterium]
MERQATIGLEIHAELATASKMFCDSSNDPSEKHPNINVCPVCMGHPGTLPVINKEAVKHVLRVGLALGGEANRHSQFDRKNYFYPDLPKGYQISQYEHPLIVGGGITLASGKRIRIRRIHLEEDTGRLLHEIPAGLGNSPRGAPSLSKSRKTSRSFVDFNRAGIPLMEMVTEPDISSAGEAKEFAEEFRRALLYLEASRANLEKGEMRLEANVSLNMGTKTEVKNINSFAALFSAIEYEIERQTEALKNKKELKQETRGWDDVKQKTFSQRLKESSHDYRYFPEPDLPPLKVYEDAELNPDTLRLELPEMPWDKRARFAREFGLDAKACAMLASDKKLGEFFEEAVSELMEWAGESPHGHIRLLYNYLSSDLVGLMKAKELEWGDILMTPENFSELIKMVAHSEISSRAAKDVLAAMLEESSDPSDIVRDRGLAQVSGEEELQKIAQKIIEANPAAVADYKAGKQNALQFLLGQMMRETKGSANPEKAKEVLTKELE